ncbi:MAG: molybdenum cofactor biosynthesis protein MoaE [Phycisphaerales bacterium]
MHPFLDIRLVPRPLEWIAIDPFPPTAGAECAFIGRTRHETHPTHGELVRLDYHAYDAMARRVLEDLAADAIARFDGRAVRLLHALGPVAVGEASVLVQVACGHRDASFAACRMLIDRLKREAPIWKREVWADGATWSEGVAVASEDATR